MVRTILVSFVKHLWTIVPAALALGYLLWQWRYGVNQNVPYQLFWWLLIAGIILAVILTYLDVKRQVESGTVQLSEQEAHRHKIADMALKLRNRTGDKRNGIRDAIQKEVLHIQDDQFRETVFHFLRNDEDAHELGVTNSDVIDAFLQDVSESKSDESNHVSTLTHPRKAEAVAIHAKIVTLETKLWETKDKLPEDEKLLQNPQITSILDDILAEINNLGQLIHASKFDKFGESVLHQYAQFLKYHMDVRSGNVYWARARINTNLRHYINKVKA